MDWDYIIVGAGSAGCVLANRLSADPACRVLLIEAGGYDWSPYVHVPAAIIKAIGNPALDWCYSAEPDASRDTRKDLWPAGRILGGSSSINGMLFVRGQRSDFDAWAALGCSGWSYDDVLPYFRKLESTTLGQSQFRGRDGPQVVNALRSVHPLANVFVNAAVESGIPFNEDYNGASQLGVAYSQVNQKRGQRFSASRAYLWPIRRRKNLSIVTQAKCRRINFECVRANGITYQHKGQVKKATASREVILSAGVIGSPKLLQLSGVGAAGQLQRHDIPVIVDNSNVGAHLTDHPEGMVGIDVNVSTYNTEINSWKIVLHGLRWLLSGRGPASSPYPHAVAFLKSSAEGAHPDIQVQLGPYAFSFSEDGVVPYHKPAISASVNLSYPANRGQVQLRSSNPDDAPIIDHELLSSKEDVAKLTAACRDIRKIFAGAAFDTFRVGERLPGPQVQSDDEWERYLRQTAFLGYHGVSTCRMGSPEKAVVDTEFRVHGAQHLRVIDASAIPQSISGNTNATVMMMAEKAADSLRQEHRVAV